MLDFNSWRNTYNILQKFFATRWTACKHNAFWVQLLNNGQQHCNFVEKNIPIKIFQSNDVPLSRSYKHKLKKHGQNKYCSDSMKCQIFGVIVNGAQHHMAILTFLIRFGCFGGLEKMHQLNVQFDILLNCRRFLIFYTANFFHSFKKKIYILSVQLVSKIVARRKVFFFIIKLLFCASSFHWSIPLRNLVLSR